MVEKLRGLLSRVSWVLAIGASALILSACDNAEERADKHFEKALELAAAGDVDRASVEFRNVFRLDVNHMEARAAYAQILRDSGNLSGSVGQYLRLLEQDQENRPARIAVSEMLAEVGAWEELQEQTEIALEQFPADADFQRMQLISAYRLAVNARNFEAATAYAEAVRTSIDDVPDLLSLRRVLIDDAMRDGRMEEALAQLDTALEYSPHDPTLLPVRLSVLAALGDTFEMEAQMRDTISRDPSSEEGWLTLVRFLVAQERFDEAEDSLRDYIDNAADVNSANLLLAEFLDQFRSPEAAIAELDRLIAAGPVQPEIRTRRAMLVFDTGDHADAIAQMRALIAEIDDATESREYRVSLARMLMLDGQKDDARALVTEVLTEDSAHVEANKMQAAWLIEDDETGQAIASLRVALEQDPSDWQIYILLSRAHERDGNDELVGEMLALAVEASDYAAAPTIRYGRYLMARNKPSPAEGIIIDALRRDPTNSGLLTVLGQAYLSLREWGRLEQVIATLRNFDEEGSRAQADLLTAEMLNQQARADEAVAFLERLVSEGGNTLFNADAAIVRAHLSRDDAGRAIAYLDEQMAERPDDTGLLALRAATLASAGALPQAVEAYRELVALEPTVGGFWTGLYRSLYRMGDREAAELVLEEGLGKADDPATLKWMKASNLELAGDLDGALAIYEEMYAENSDNPIIANNLANLLVTVDQSTDSIARAFSIARRLAASNLPPYQDTYGWIAVLRGDFPDAIRALEPAAAAMANEAVVQYHLARAYQGANLEEKARKQYEVVLTLVDDSDMSDFVVDTRQRLAALDKTATASPADTPGQ